MSCTHCSNCTSIEPHFLVIMIQMYGAVNTPKSQCILSQIICSCKVWFSQPLCHIITPPRRKKYGKCVLGGFCPTFVCIVSISFREQRGAGKDTPGSTSYGDILRYPWIVRTYFRFSVASCPQLQWLIRNAFEWSCDTMWRWSILFLPRKLNKEGNRRCWRRRMAQKVRSKKRWKGRSEGKCVRDPQVHMAPCAPDNQR